MYGCICCTCILIEVRLDLTFFFNGEFVCEIVFKLSNFFKMVRMYLGNSRLKTEKFLPTETL